MIRVSGLNGRTRLSRSVKAAGTLPAVRASEGIGDVNAAG
jgi:hypothetical protein